LLVAAILGACGAAAPSTTLVAAPPSPAQTTAERSPPPTLEMSDGTPSPSTRAPAATRTPTAPAAPKRWTRPRRAIRASCYTLSFTIDDRGTSHIAGLCRGGVRVFSSRDAIDWAATRFAPPADRFEVGPLLATDGDNLYLATSWRAPVPQDTCGPEYVNPVGVYVRTKQLPSGAWSEPFRIGRAGDRIHAFRVADGVIHAVVEADPEVDTGAWFYEMQRGSTHTRQRIPGQGASLRVGDDGRARLAYTAGDRLVYARVDGARLVKETIATSDDPDLLAPMLVLDAGNAGYVLWTRDRVAALTETCGDHPKPGRRDGTYLGSDASGTWVTRRISRAMGEKALTLDPSTGDVHVVLAGDRLQHLTSTDGAAWTTTDMRGTTGMYGPLIRVDPATGRTVVVMLNETDRGIFVMTRG
jgi:hypothetical protein